jgi:hypothetical protein
MLQRIVCRIEHTKHLIGGIYVCEGHIVKTTAVTAAAMVTCYATNASVVSVAGTIGTAITATIATAVVHSALIGYTANATAGISVFIFIHRLYFLVLFAVEHTKA